MSALLLQMLLYTSAVFSQSSSCTPEQVLTRSCEFFLQNKDKKEFKISDGSILSNPFYSAPVNLDQTTQVLSAGYGGGGQSIEEYIQYADKEVEFQIQMEELVSSSGVKDWPKRSIKHLSGTFHVGSLLAVLEPDNDSYKNYGNAFFFPYPPSDSQAKFKSISQAEAQKIVQQIGEETFQKIKKLFEQHNREVSSSLTKLKTPEVQLVKTLPTQLTAQSRQDELFKYAKYKLKQMVVGGRKPSDLNEYDQNILTRIENVTLGKMNAELSLSCSAEQPNAFFVPLSNKVYICPSALMLSDANLASILGHEIGHAIDPCLSSCDHFKINKPMIENYLTDQKSDKELQTLDAIKLIDTFGGEYASVSATGARSADIHNLSKSGFLTHVAKPIPASRHPFRNVKSCLIEVEGFDDITSEDVEAQIRDDQNSFKRIGQPLSQEQVSAIRKYYQQNNQCEGIGKKKSEMGEAMSDVTSAYVLSEYLKDHPPKNEIDAIASMGYFIQNSCYAAPNPLDGVLMNQHPLTSRRVKNILLNFPGVLKHFSGCDSTSKSSSCFNQFNYLNNSSKLSNQKEKSQK